jgi:hypothetical protein
MGNFDGEQLTPPPSFETAERDLSGAGVRRGVETALAASRAVRDVLGANDAEALSAYESWARPTLRAGLKTRMRSMAAPSRALRSHVLAAPDVGSGGLMHTFPRAVSSGMSISGKQLLNSKTFMRCAVHRCRATART